MIDTTGSAWKGFALGWGLNFLHLAAAAVLMVYLRNDRFLTLTGYSLLGIGLFQGIYVVPLYVSFARKGEKDTAKGILVAASVTALLNASCWALI